MAKGRKKRKAKLRKQSLARNIALLFVSIAVLAGASVLFTMLNTRPEYSYAPIEKNLSKMVSKASAKTPSPADKPGPEKGSAGTFEYSYWDILQDKGSAADEAYTVQIATFRSRDEAQRFADGLEDKNHLTCEVEQKGKAFAVRWGSFRTRETAERYCSTLSGRLQRECTVVKP